MAGGGRRKEIVRIKGIFVTGALTNWVGGPSKPQKVNNFLEGLVKTNFMNPCRSIEQIVKRLKRFLMGQMVNIVKGTTEPKG